MSKNDMQIKEQRYSSLLPRSISTQQAINWISWSFLAISAAVLCVTLLR